MKSAIVYYSYTGNTHRMAQIILGVLKSKGEEAIPVRIRPLKEETNFFRQCLDAFKGKKPDLYRTLVDLKDYDRIFLGSPVWAFKAAPAVNTYLDICSPMNGIDAIPFVTYASGVGKERALIVMEKGLEAKGAKVIGKISFQQSEELESCKNKLLKIL